MKSGPKTGLFLGLILVVFQDKNWQKTRKDGMASFFDLTLL